MSFSGPHVFPLNRWTVFLESRPQCFDISQVMESKLTEVGIDRLKTLSRVKVEVKDETSGATLVLPIETVGGEVGGTELLAVVDVDQDGTVIQRQSEIIGPDDMDDDAGVGMVMDDIMEGKENASKVSVVKTGT